MKARHLFPLLLILAACNQATEQEAPSLPEPVRFHASIGDLPDASRTYAQPEAGVIKTLWNAGDCITVFNRSTRNGKYRFLGAEGAADGDFEEVAAEWDGVPEALDANFAVYPYNAAYVFDKANERIALDFPGSQTWYPGTFDPAAALMIARSDGFDLGFRHVAGYLCLKLYGEGVSLKSITIQGNGGEPLSGRLYAWIDGEEAVHAAFAGEGTDGSVTLTATTPVALPADEASAIPFWICLPPQSFPGGFTVRVCDAEDHICELRTERSVEIRSAHLLRMKAKQVVPEEDAPVDLGLYFDGGVPVLYQAASQQFSLYKAEGKVWIRLVDPEAMTMYQLGPVPEGAAPGDAFDAALEYYSFLSPGDNTSGNYSLRVVSVGERTITLRAPGEAWFVVRF